MCQYLEAYEPPILEGGSYMVSSPTRSIQYIDVNTHAYTYMHAHTHTHTHTNTNTHKHKHAQHTFSPSLEPSRTTKLAVLGAAGELGHQTQPHCTGPPPLLLWTCCASAI